MALISMGCPGCAADEIIAMCVGNVRPGTVAFCPYCLEWWTYQDDFSLRSLPRDSFGTRLSYCMVQRLAFNIRKKWPYLQRPSEYADNLFHDNIECIYCGGDNPGTNKAALVDNDRVVCVECTNVMIIDQDSAEGVRMPLPSESAETHSDAEFIDAVYALMVARTAYRKLIKWHAAKAN